MIRFLWTEFGFPRNEDTLTPGIKVKFMRGRVFKLEGPVERKMEWVSCDNWKFFLLLFFFHAWRCEGSQCFQDVGRRFSKRESCVFSQSSSVIQRDEASMFKLIGQVERMRLSGSSWLTLRLRRTKNSQEEGYTAGGWKKRQRKFKFDLVFDSRQMLVWLYVDLTVVEPTLNVVWLQSLCCLCSSSWLPELWLM